MEDFNLVITNSRTRNIYFNEKRVMIIISLRLLKGIFKVLSINFIDPKDTFHFLSIALLKSSQKFIPEYLPLQKYS